MNNLLYIGLNGYAGSGKDTVAKMIAFILNHNLSKEDAYVQFMRHTNEFPITHPDQDIHSEYCYIIAFADQLKRICSVMFEVPLKYFYDNKSSAWICLNHGFELTEIKPSPDAIVSAEDYYVGNYKDRSSSSRIYMSLRELLVYVGTYVLQQSLTKNVFINIVEKKIHEVANRSSYKYVICTDVRFEHEMQFIRDHHGIMVNIVRDGVQQLDNVAEHDLDDVDDYDYIIENNGTYEDLFYQVYDMINDNIEWKNQTIHLYSHDSSNNILVLKKDEGDCMTWELVTEFGTMRTVHDNGNIIAIDPSGGPMISVGEPLSEISDASSFMSGCHKISKIWFDIVTGHCYIKTTKHTL